MPGVSTSSRRRSGWDGFASSSSWNAVRIPNTDPRTANEPTVATAAPPADDGGRAHELEHAVDVLVAEQRERR